MSLFTKSLESVRSREAERHTLLTQLERQVNFFTQFGIAAHEISKIRVRASGHKNAISFVTMKDGTVHTLNGFNAKLVLDGKEEWPNANA